jgi:hypothetical protein
LKSEPTKNGVADPLIKPIMAPMCPATTVKRSNAGSGSPSAVVVPEPKLILPVAVTLIRCPLTTWMFVADQAPIAITETVAGGPSGAVRFAVGEGDELVVVDRLEADETVVAAVPLPSLGRVITRATMAAASTTITTDARARIRFWPRCGLPGGFAAAAGAETAAGIAADGGGDGVGAVERTVAGSLGRLAGWLGRTVGG